MLDLSCHCGAVRVRTAKRPDYVNDCNCTLCSKSGARWAYFHPGEVTVDGATSGYVRRDKAEAGAEVHFCRVCGSTTHFVLTPEAVARHGNVMMGVNTRLADDAELAGVESRFPDGRAWDGASEFGYRRAAEVIGGGQPA
jgi:hypothetical protein